MMAAVPYLLDQLRAHFHWLDQAMADGRLFLQGAAAGLADLAAYHPIWFLQRNFGPTAAPLGGFPRLLAWAERVAATGHGQRRLVTSQDALAVAKASTSSASTALGAAPLRVRYLTTTSSRIFGWMAQSTRKVPETGKVMSTVWPISSSPESKLKVALAT